MPQSHEITDRAGYLARMAGPVQDKLRPTLYFPRNPQTILDVGCADGAVTLEIAKMFPQSLVKGIDLDLGFIDQANRNAQERAVKNVVFEQAYIRDVLDRNEEFDVITSISVNHEIASYGNGKSSLVGALARFKEMLRDEDSVIGIRDMILHESAKSSDFMMPQVIDKIRTNESITPRLKDFEELNGDLKTQESVNHFLLKYMYTANWDRELREHYLPFSAEEYNRLLPLMDLQIVHQEYYLLPFLKNKWMQDFGLTEAEVSAFGSTGLIIAQEAETTSRRFD